MQRALKQKQLQQLYLWVDQVPLSRPKRNMARDFSDAVLVAEIINYFNPKMIELHNYQTKGNIQTKLSNWKTLNDKVLKKMKIVLTKQDMTALSNCQPTYAQRLIFMIKKYILQQPEQSQVSRMTKKPLLPVPASQQKKTKVYTFKQIKKQRDVKQILTCKDQQIQKLKEVIELYALKFTKLDQVVKSKDRQIQQLVKKIKSKGIL